MVPFATHRSAGRERRRKATRRQSDRSARTRGSVLKFKPETDPDFWERKREYEAEVQSQMEEAMKDPAVQELLT